jgi:UDP-3-O-[3-hydroxymyristoyl] glucosamine N-acyltransferase
VKVKRLLKLVESEGVNIGESRVEQNSEVWTISEFFPGKPGAIAFLKNSEDPIFQKPSKSSLVFIPTSASPAPVFSLGGYAKSDTPRLAFAVASHFLALELDIYGTSTQDVATSARIGPLVKLLGNVKIGEGTKVGEGTIIGREGFGFERLNDQSIFRLPHIGTVEIGSEVEIGANCSIDRGTFGATTIGNQTKIDNQVNISHNVSVGSRCLIAAGARISGSTVVGDSVWIGPNAVISNGLTIGQGAQIGIGSVVFRDVPPGGKVIGNPAKVYQ